MPLGVYDGIPFMDWLKAHHANFFCHLGIISFLSLESQVQVDGIIEKPKATLVKANKLLRGLRKNQPFYVAKVSKVEKEEPK